MRVYINTDKKDEVLKFGVKLCSGNDSWFKEVSELSKFYFEIKDSGIFAVDPILPDGVIKGVTICEQIDDGFVRPGVYKYEDAKAEIDTNKHFTEDKLVIYQKVMIIAKSISGARKMLSLLRQGKIQPTEEYKGHMKDYLYLLLKNKEEFTPEFLQ